jgi:hypothetical protein
VLVSRQVIESVPWLLEQAGKADAKVAAATFRALGRLADPRQLDAVVQRLTARSDTSAHEEAERALINIARKITDPAKQSDPVLAAYAKVNAIPIRCVLLRVLNETAGLSALETIVAATSDSDAAVSDTAVRALANWPDAPALGSILEQAKQTGNVTHRVLLLRGFLRLLALPGQRDAEETLKAYAEALQLIKRPEEKKLALSGLAAAAAPGTLKLITPMLDDPAVQTEAAVVVFNLIKKNPREDPTMAKPALKKAVTLLPDAKLKKEAEEIYYKVFAPLDRIEVERKNK